ncbi:DNA-directed RNA polymerase subunit beta' [Aurantiacibacter sediminis]|uniref:DNA-directed RNA polymerase subunit beta n=1 Tax=Aurantiacibacter sediminis TaxID=2793064 RepID=A0ABS0N112_9SPHN|nr:DNA-directed RNA polymerase subunit beta' [Aurantiacibacter sediminis]MBH5321654.1 DNA-directed RNA polymerase subunit beta' [Aurantiacibacter sediminis]
MSHIRKSSPTTAQVAVANLVAKLSRMPRIGDYGIDAAKTVMALRLVALCSKSGHDPMAELTKRLNDVGAAKNMLALLDRCGALWPEAVHVHRPCCAELSPDETIIAGMAQAASDGDHRAFDKVLDGFIPAAQREGLFAEALMVMETL